MKLNTFGLYICDTYIIKYFVVATLYMEGVCRLIPKSNRLQGQQFANCDCAILQAHSLQMYAIIFQKFLVYLY